MLGQRLSNGSSVHFAIYKQLANVVCDYVTCFRDFKTVEDFDRLKPTNYNEDLKC